MKIIEKYKLINLSHCNHSLSSSNILKRNFNYQKEMKYLNLSCVLFIKLNLWIFYLSLSSLKLIKNILLYFYCSFNILFTFHLRLYPLSYCFFIKKILFFFQGIFLTHKQSLLVIDQHQFDFLRFIV
jgi:hypothetical protein